MKPPAAAYARLSTTEIDSPSGDVELGTVPPSAPLPSPPQDASSAIVPKPTYSSFRVGITLSAYCISGTLLTLANKLAIVAFPVPNTLLVIQNGVTIVMLMGGSFLWPGMFQKMPVLTVQVVKAWLPLVLLFVAMLVSSLQALMSVSAVTLIVMRNLSTLCVAFFERLILGEKIHVLTWLTLIGIFLGATLYGLRDMSFNSVGYFWLAINVGATSSYQIYVKTLIEKSKELGPFGMSYITNVLSVPIFIIIAIATKEYEGLAAWNFSPDNNVRTISIVALSAILGFALSTTAFMINKMITATSMMVANNVNKFAVILLSEIFVERSMDAVSGFGTLLVLLFGWLYSKARALKEMPAFVTRMGCISWFTVFIVSAGSFVGIVFILYQI